LLQVSRVVLVVSMILAVFHPPAHAEGTERPVKTRTSYRTIKVDGLSIFYREAGPKDAPTLLLLHGLPSSSRMFEPLYSRLSDHYHLVAPDYPGFGHSGQTRRNWMREKQPRLLVIWRKYDASFDSSEPESYRRDMPDSEVHIVDGGHFALDTAADDLASLIGQFM